MIGPSDLEEIARVAESLSLADMRVIGQLAWRVARLEASEGPEAALALAEQLERAVTDEVPT